MGKPLIMGALLGAVLSMSCSAELPALPEQSSVTLRFEPDAEPGSVTPVTRVHVAGWSNPASLRLFRDGLSDYHLGRLRSGELPQTLVEREVSSIAFAHAEGVTSMPTEVLAPGQYSLASAERGLLVTFSVVADTRWPLLTRLWPPSHHVGTLAAYCGERAPATEQVMLLEPSATSAAISRGLGDGFLADQCVSLQLEQPLSSGSLALPPVLDGVLLDPEPLHGSSEQAAHSTTCVEDEVALGAGCAAVGDDRLVLRADQALLWLFREPAIAVIALESAGAKPLTGLVPDQVVILAGEVVDAWGRRTPFREQVRTKPAAARVIINEVLANALGAEPAQEWIELVNDGSAPANLRDHRLEDGAGSVLLPDVTLASGAHALLVSVAYAADAALDVVAVPETLHIVVPALAKNGLSNGGEPLRLFDANGTLVSRFPALRSGQAGVSLARRTPSSADDDMSAFGLHAPPGASPGSPNALPANE